MLKFFLHAFIVLLFLFSQQVIAEMKTLSWFSNTDATELTITEYKSVSDNKVVSSITIKDRAAIAELIKRIQALSASGDEMVKKGSKTSKIVLNFSFADQTYQSIDFLNKKIVTPSTGFLSTKNQIEADLYRDIDGLVEPDVNKRILKIKNQQIKFKDFLIVYTGEKYTPQPQGGPTIGPTYNTFFDVWENGSANRVSIDIFTGQIPPQPKGFVANQKIYNLLTFYNVAKERLGPNYFEVSDQLPKR